MQRDTDAIAGGQHRAGLGSDGPGRVGKDVLREGDVRLGNPVAKAILQHRLGADGSLFRGLEHGNEGSTPRSPCAGEQVRRAQQARHVDVVAARMHDAGNATGIVRRGQCRRVGQARALLDGKGVHVGACKDGLSRAIPHDPDDAGSADLFEDFVSELPELRRRERSGPGFVEAQLRVCVEILVRALLPGRYRRQTIQDVIHARHRRSSEFGGGYRLPALVTVYSSASILLTKSVVVEQSTATTSIASPRTDGRRTYYRDDAAKLASGSP